MSGKRLGEFRGHIAMVAAGVGCNATGMGPVMFYGIGTFLPLLHAEFGWSRSQISFGATIMSLASLLFGAAVGKLSDRYGAHRVVAASFVAYGAVILAFAPNFGSIWSFWIFSFLVAMLGQGATPVVIVRPVIGAFRASRGLALGIVAGGSGIGAFWVPRTIAEVSILSGWRTAYVAVALVAIATAPAAWLWLREKPRAADSDDGPAGIASGMSGREAMRAPAFWILTAISLAMAAAVSGIVIHTVSFLRDLNVDPVTAASVASLAGMASIAGRLGMGAFLDRFDTVLVSVVALALAMIGTILLWAGGAHFAVPAMLLIGTAMGAETDMLAFMTARLFGRAHYGVLFGWLFSVFTVGYGLSPFLIGWLRETYGSYLLAFEACMGLLLVSALLIAALGPALRRAPFDH